MTNSILLSISILLAGMCIVELVFLTKFQRKANQIPSVPLPGIFKLNVNPSGKGIAQYLNISKSREKQLDKTFTGEKLHEIVGGAKTAFELHTRFVNMTDIRNANEFFYITYLSVWTYERFKAEKGGLDPILEAVLKNPFGVNL